MNILSKREKSIEKKILRFQLDAFSLFHEVLSLKKEKNLIFNLI